MFGGDVLMASLMFLTFTVVLRCKRRADWAGELVSCSTVAKSRQLLLIFLQITSEEQDCLFLTML